MAERLQIPMTSPKGVKLKTSGKLCESDIEVTPTFEIHEAPNIQPLSITENGTYTAENGIDGYSPITVEVASSGGDADKYFEGGHAEVSLPNATKIRQYAFYMDKALTNISIPNATSIEANAFYSASKLQYVTMPNVTSIGNSAFQGCGNYRAQDLPQGLISIGDYAFNSCQYFRQTVDISGVFPASLKTIGNYAFTGAKYNLTTCVFPSGLESIGTSAFGNCSILTSVTFQGTPTSIANNAFPSNVTTINVPWAEGAVANAPWGATKATINYNYVG